MPKRYCCSCDNTWYCKGLCDETVLGITTTCYCWTCLHKAFEIYDFKIKAEIVEFRSPKFMLRFKDENGNSEYSVPISYVSLMTTCYPHKEIEIIADDL